MPTVACPACGESERLTGARGPDGSVKITCGGCGTVWDRDATRRCGHCGSRDLEYAPRPLWAKGRGDQHTPAGRIDAYSCRSCGGHDVTAKAPPPAPAVVPTAPPAPAAKPGWAPAAAAAGPGGSPAHRLLPLQHLDAEIDRLRQRAANPPERRKADQSAAALREAAATLTALSQEAQGLRASPTAGSPATAQALAQVQQRLDEARRQGEALAAEHRQRLAAVTEAAAAVASALSAAQARRDAAAAELDPALRTAYESARKRMADPVVPVVDIGTCGGCRIVIPAGELDRAREAAATELARCPGCNRFLIC